jgi:hypothetical protein
MRRLLVLAATLLLFLELAGTLRAQTATASVTGQVTDPSKAMISGAGVVLINTGTDLRYEGTTNDTGSYYIMHLPAGSYRMQVEKLGFKTVIKPDIVLHVQDVLEVNFEMALGSAAENITVQAGATPLQLTTSGLSAVVNSTAVVELPLNGRSWADLATLQAGVNAIICWMG